MKIGDKVAYVMTSLTGAVTYNSERFTAKEFGDRDDDGQDAITVPLGRGWGWHP